MTKHTGKITIDCGEKTCDGCYYLDNDYHGDEDSPLVINNCCLFQHTALGLGGNPFRCKKCLKTFTENKDGNNNNPKP